MTAPLLILEMSASAADWPGTLTAAETLDATARDASAPHERRGVDAISLSDGIASAGLHPILAASYLARRTSALGLLVRTDAVYVEPFHLAMQLQTLDHVSAGRAGWLVRSELSSEAAEAVGREHLSGDALRGESADVTRAVRALWDSWADDAVIRDVATGRFLDAARLQYADVEAERFSVRGPSFVPRSPQGQLPVLLADVDSDISRLGIEPGIQADARVLTVHALAHAQQGSAEELARALTAEVGLALAGSERTGTDRTELAGLRIVGLEHAAIADPQRVAHTLAILRSCVPELAPARAGGKHAASTAPTLRERLGWARPEVTIDPERRADRARLAEQQRTAPSVNPAKES